MAQSFSLRKRHLTVLVAICTACLADVLTQTGRAQTPPPTDWATVTGHVSDTEGKPVGDAKISVFPMDVAVSGPMPSSRTDKNGRYRLLTPAFSGKTRLCAVKESAGYPDTQGLLFSSEKDVMPEISLVPGGVLDNIDMHLGPPDGVIEGAVVDSKTGRPISSARLTLHRDHPESFYSATLPSDGHFLFALPAVPITIQITAPGYQRWSYHDPDRAAATLLLQSNEHRRVSARLTPVGAGDD
jgi:Carboxypeptidase regulatory-like domain